MSVWQERTAFMTTQNCTHIIVFQITILKKEKAHCLEKKKHPGTSVFTERLLLSGSQLVAVTPGPGSVRAWATPVPAEHAAALMLSSATHTRAHTHTHVCAHTHTHTRVYLHLSLPNLRFMVGSEGLSSHPLFILSVLDGMFWLAGKKPR